VINVGRFHLRERGAQSVRVDRLGQVVRRSRCQMGGPRNSTTSEPQAHRGGSQGLDP